MKPLASLLLTLSLPALLHAEEPAPPASIGTYIPAPLVAPIFVPPPPVVPKVPLTDAEATIVLHDDSGLTTTLQRGQASMAPDLPAPEPVSESPSPPLEHSISQIVSINMGGTIYDHRVSVVSWQHPVTRQPYQAVLGFDIGLLTPIGQFIRNGVTHQSHLLFSNHDTRGPLARRAAARGRPPIQVPEIAPDAYRIIEGDPADPLGIQPLIALRDLYLAEKPRLQKLNADLANYQQDAQAWAAAHPAPVEAPVFWFKPHRNSRYLTPEDKDNQQQAAQERASLTIEGEAP